VPMEDLAKPDQGYKCNCKPKFTGRQCQRPRDSCHPNPCQNHGQCIMDDLRGFICECKDGNTGRLCEKMLIGKNGKRIRKSLDHDGKEKVQFCFANQFKMVWKIYENTVKK